MNPKEKANELFDKYYIICQEFTEEIQCSIQAKQCALIAVEEIIKDQNGDDATIGNKTWWWQQVKHEIEKI